MPTVEVVYVSDETTQAGDDKARLIPLTFAIEVKSDKRIDLDSYDDAYRSEWRRNTIAMKIFLFIEEVS